MSITREFKLPLFAGRSVPLLINANQYDSGETWIFTLLDENGQKYTPASGAIIGLKSDGHVIANAGTVNSSGQVVITETEQMTASPGKNIYEVLIDSDTHGTANFTLFVERRPGDQEEPSDSDLSMFQEAIDAAATIGNVEYLVDEVAVLGARMDTFTHLTDGSTTGDAELADIRVGADGTTYPTAGDAVRGQVRDLNNALKPVSERFEEDVLSGRPNTWGYIDVNGAYHESSNWRAYYFTPEEIDLFTRLELWNGSATNNIVAVAFFSGTQPSAETLIKTVKFYTTNAINYFYNIPFPDGAILAVVSNRKSGGDAKIYGIKSNLIGIPEIVDKTNRISERLNQKPLAFLNTLSSTVTGAISSLTTIDDVLFAFAYASGESASVGKKYTIGQDGTLTYLEDFSSNIGHQNTVDYSPENGALVTVHGTQIIWPTFEVCIFENVTKETTAFDLNNAIKYDLSNAGIGNLALNAVWGFDNFGKNDILIVFTRDDTLEKRYVSIMQLGKGTNQLPSGTFISGKESNQFNGSYMIHYTIERPYISGENTNDMCYFNGKIYEVSTQQQIGIRIFIHSFDDFNTSIKTERMLLERFNATGGGTNREYEGIAISNGRMFIGSNGAGLYVFNAPR